MSKKYNFEDPNAIKKLKIQINNFISTVFRKSLKNQTLKCGKIREILKKEDHILLQIMVLTQVFNITKIEKNDKNKGKTASF